MQANSTAPLRGAQLMDVLQDWPELNAIAGHQAHGAFDRRAMSARLWVISRRSHLE